MSFFNLLLSGGQSRSEVSLDSLLHHHLCEGWHRAGLGLQLRGLFSKLLKGADFCDHSGGVGAGEEDRLLLRRSRVQGAAPLSAGAAPLSAGAAPLSAGGGLFDGDQNCICSSVDNIYSFVPQF